VQPDLTLSLKGRIESGTEPRSFSLFDRIEKPMPSSHTSDRKTTFVIVDDDETFRYALERSLAPEHEILASVGDGAAGVDAVIKHCPDIVLLDISMPVMNGLEAAERIAKNCPSVFIIFVTSHTNRAYVDEAFHRGATGYVQKGNRAQLQEAICAVLDGQRYQPAFCH
jgi:DNA-binding NarL/FixJ family response regulator